MNSRRNARLLVPAAALLVACVVLPAVWPPLRLGAAAFFCVLVPGSGWAWRLARTGRILSADRLAVAVVLSLCATIAVATAMVVAAQWSVSVGMVVLGVVAAAGYVPWARWAGRAEPVLRHALRYRRLGRHGGGVMESE